MQSAQFDRHHEEMLIAKVPIGALFEHYKGKKYKIIGLGRHTETLEMCVFYQALYASSEFGDHAMWIRPLEMFLETVVQDGKEIPRFRFITPQFDYRLGCANGIAEGMD